MKERPILFSGPMVRALLAGTKTQTRRVVKPQPPYQPVLAKHLARRDYPIWHCEQWQKLCPYGQPGDRLWVREAWRPNWTVEHGHVIEFSADNSIRCFNGCCNGLQVIEPGYSWLTSHYDSYRKPWRPSIHMPRWASRILLEIAAVRVERLHDISEDDLAAEGIQEIIDAGVDHDGYPRDAYRALWESINGHGSWAANPWVFVISFRRVE